MVTMFYTRPTLIPNKKLMLKMDEIYAATSVAELDIPDPDEMARSCGTTYHNE
jgi:hypothetical protein